MVLTTRRVRPGQAEGAVPFALDDATKAHLAPHFDLGNDVWAERFIDALVEGYLDSPLHRDARSSWPRSGGPRPTSSSPVGSPSPSKSTWRSSERLRMRVEGKKQQKLAAALANAMFGGETLEKESC